MKLNECWTEIEAVPFTTAMHDVFDQISAHPAWPFLPVVDAQRRPLGVVREFDLKYYAYARFGRELIKRRPLSDFLKASLALPATTNTEDLLGSSANNPNPDGIILTEDGKYRAALLTPAIMRLFEAHRLETEVRLVQAQKMEAIGTLAGGIAHDLNNILMPILGYADMMKSMLAHGEPIESEMLEQIIVSGNRAREAVKQILTFSRHQTAERCPLSLGAAIRDTVRLLRSSLPATIEINMQLDAEEDRVTANPSEIQRVILNLCTNAYHAMRSGGRLQISLGPHQGPLLGWFVKEAPPNGDYFRLSIADTGTGIAPDLLPRIFEPFFTTKKQGEGTGLGLSLVHGIITRCQGLVSVETTLGQGSTFHLYLPRLHPAHSSEAAVPAPALQPVGSGLWATARRRIRTLLVDDEFAITHLASRFLPQYGIQLETENNSVKAWERFSEGGEEFDLLITDQLMPGLTGMELIGRMRKMRPEMPIILCTGYSESVSAEQARDLGVRELLLKPFDFRQMATLIQKLVPTQNLQLPSVATA
jgi:signal transduction histidine kinase/CheY-like chemotaxis protein